MPKITLVEHNGTNHTVDAEVGTTLMQSALDNGISGIDADCGGACACGTCHCFIQGDGLAITGEASELEGSMLSMRPDREKNSRLSCQIDITDAMDGLVVQLPEFQM